MAEREMGGCSKEEVVEKLEKNPPRLLGLKFRSHWLLPSNQFYQGKLVPGFEKVLGACCKSAGVWGISRWFGFADVDLQSGNEELSPRDWLIQGLPLEQVLSIAENMETGP